MDNQNSIADALFQGLQRQISDRCLNDSENCLWDVKIKVDDEIFYCHKVILSAYSDFFLSMFTLDFKEKNEETVTLQSVDASSFRIILDFLYGRRTDDLKAEEAEDLLKASSALQIDCLSKLATDNLGSNVNSSNAIHMINIGVMYSSKKLVESASSVVAMQFEAVVNSGDYLSLDEESLIEVLKSKDLIAPSEDFVARAVIDWLILDEKRLPLASKVLEFVHLPLVSSDFFVSMLEKNSFLNADPKCAPLISEVMRYQMQPGRRYEIDSVRTQHRGCADFFTAVYLFRRTGPCLYSLQHGDDFLTSLPLITGKCYAVCSYGNSIFVSGGSANKRSMVEYAPQFKDTSGSRYISRLEVKHANLPASYEQHSMVSVGNDLYVVGGSHDIYKFNVSSNAWSHVGTLNIPVHAASAFVQGEKIIVLSGYHYLSALFESTIQCFDTRTKRCVNLPMHCMKKSRATVSNGTAYIVNEMGSIATFSVHQGFTKIGSFENFLFKRWLIFIFNDILFVVNTFKENGNIRKWHLIKKKELPSVSLGFQSHSYIEGIAVNIARCPFS